MKRRGFGGFVRGAVGSRGSVREHIQRLSKRVLLVHERGRVGCLAVTPSCPSKSCLTHARRRTACKKRPRGLCVWDGAVGAARPSHKGGESPSIWWGWDGSLNER